MANVTAQNNIRYNIDNLKTATYGVITSNNGSELKCPTGSQVKGFSFDYTQPTGTEIYMLFREGSNGTWFKLKTDGTKQDLSLTGDLNFETLQMYGNTINELKNLTRITAFENKNISYSIGLQSADLAQNGAPQIKFGLKILSDTQLLQKTETSPVYDLGKEGQISKISVDTNNTSGGTTTVTAQITKPDGSTSGWVDPASLAGEKATNIQFQALYKVTKVNQGSASLTETRMLYTDGSTVVSGLASGEIYSSTNDWFINVSQCRITVRHAPLIVSNIRAAVAFRTKPIIVHNENLGKGSGVRKTFQLAHINGIRYDSITLYYDNEQVYQDYEINTHVGRVTCTAPEGVIVTCDYEYNWDLEEWHDIALTDRTSMMDYDVSEFKYTLPESSERRSVCAVKIILDMDEGKITNEVLGIGTGITTTYKLSHIIKDGNITLTANNTAIASKNWIVLDDPQYVRVNAPIGQTIRASYDWISEPPCVYQMAAVFAD